MFVMGLAKCQKLLTNFERSGYALTIMGEVRSISRCDDCHTTWCRLSITMLGTRVRFLYCASVGLFKFSKLHSVTLVSCILQIQFPTISQLWTQTTFQNNNKKHLLNLGATDSILCRVCLEEEEAHEIPLSCLRSNEQIQKDADTLE